MICESAVAHPVALLSTFSPGTHISSPLWRALQFAGIFTLTFDAYAPVFVGLDLKKIPGSSLQPGTLFREYLAGLIDDHFF
jgi:hypothetical protein